LRRRIKKHQWIAVFLLLDGVMAAEIALCHAKGDDDNNHPSCDSLDAYPVVALSLVLFGATLAALAGIAVEFVYKEHFSMSIHLQNAQLYAFGALANGFVVLFSSSATSGVDGGRGQDDEVLGEDGASFANSTEKALHANDSAFRGFGLVSTWLVVLTLAAFGVVSSLIMKHLSNIAKVFNSAAGMVVVTVVSMVFLGTKVTLPFFLAAATIVASLVSFYGENHGEGGSRGESANRVLGPGSGHVSNGAVSAFTEDEPFVTAGTPGTPLSSRGSFAFDAPNANETKQLL
jgi:hypothetical protein